MAVVLLGLSGWVFFSSMRSSKAYPILSTTHWANRTGRWGQSPSYTWLPNGDLAYLETSGAGKLEVRYQKVNAKGPRGAVRHGPELPADIFATSFTPSPDEQWVAYIRRSPLGTVLISANGQKTRTFPGLILAWLPDSRRCLGFSTASPGTLTMYHLDSPHTENVPPEAQAGILTPGLMGANSTELLIGDSDSPGHQFDDPPITPATMTVRSFRTSQPDVVQKEWQVTLPAGMESSSAIASPDNKHLLWICGKNKISWFERWRNRLFPSHQTGPMVGMHFFVSDIHGEDMHPILTDGIGRTWTVNPTWTPDSKHVSFIDKGQLYLLPVD